MNSRVGSSSSENPRDVHSRYSLLGLFFYIITAAMAYCVVVVPGIVKSLKIETLALVSANVLANVLKAMF